MKNSEFHIEQIIELIKEQEPDRLDLIEELEKSERKKWIRQPYIVSYPRLELLICPI